MEEETATIPAADLSKKEPSFQGRLQLKDFMFVSKSNTATTTTSSSSIMGRSPKLAASPTGVTPSRGSSTLNQGSPSKATASKPNPSKRKATEESEPEPELKSEPVTTTTTTAARRYPSMQTSRSTKRPRARKGEPSSNYVPPSAYAHLPLLPDAIAPDLLILFIGLNPGIETARTGHAYAHPSNLFWKLLHSSGVTPVLCAAAEDREMPARHRLGLTNIVERPSRSGAELSKAEMDDGVAALEAKCARWRPEVACVVGKGIWESVFRVKKGRAMTKGEFQYGWQDADGMRMGVVEDEEAGSEGGSGKWEGSRVFVASSTSGLAATLKPKEKERIWKELGDWCVLRRREREEDGDVLRS